MKKPWWWLFPTTMGLAAGAFVLGFVGYYAKVPAPACANANLCAINAFEALHATLQLFVLNYAATDMQSLPMRIAALLAPISLAGAAASALWWKLLTGTTITRLRGAPVDHLFIGTGSRATAIASSKAGGAAGPLRIAGLDPRDETEFGEHLDRLRRLARSTRDLQILLLEGDGRSRASLKRVNAFAARNVWVTTSDDATNLVIARRLLLYLAQHRAERPDFTGPQRLLVRVRHTRTVRADLALNGPPTGCPIEYFNLGRLVARALFVAHPPRLPPIVPGTLSIERPPHIAICGDGEMNDAIAVFAAMHWVLDTRASHCVRMTLIGPDSRAMRHRLLAEHPALGRAADDALAAAPEYRRFATFEICRSAADDLEPAQWEALQAEAPFDAVYACGASDLATARMAMRLLSLRDADVARTAQPEIVALLQEQGARQHDERPPRMMAGAFKWFDVYERLFAADEVFPGESMDQRAMLVDRAYSEARVLVDADLAVDRWMSEATDAFKWSARYSASHVDVKLALLEAASAGSTTEAALPAAIDTWFDALSQLEHRRFVAERMIDGWLALPLAHDGTRHPGAAPSSKGYTLQKTELRLNTSLLPYDALEPAIKEYDHLMIRSMPVLRKV